jgi:hypothetical protein
MACGPDGNTERYLNICGFRGLILQRRVHLRVRPIAVAPSLAPSIRPLVICSPENWRAKTLPDEAEIQKVFRDLADRVKKDVDEFYPGEFSFSTEPDGLSFEVRKATKRGELRLTVKRIGAVVTIERATKSEIPLSGRIDIVPDADGNICYEHVVIDIFETAREKLDLGEASKLVRDSLFPDPPRD